MRFDIRSGGIAGILIGILFLSGAVFVMGLLAGYDIGHQSQIAAQQVAVNYSLPEPPAVAQTPAPLAATAPASESPSTASVSSSFVKPPVATPKKLASVPKPEPPVKPEAAEAEDEPSDTTEDEPAASAPEPPPTPARIAALPPPVAPSNTRRKPFNIQIQAAMDAASATAMVRRLEALGYQPHTAPTQLNGSTWYRVEVGPYTTKEEAAAAEAELRRRYDATYGAGTTTPPSDTDSNSDDEE